jgi:16S rRNA (guanine966-N2)-methyltransferase
LGSLRIIGGRWRSRLLEFDAGAGVRPTPDRVRQTLFDWLSPLIDGARCLDLFAGSGALGFEALSRGAAQVCFVDSGATQARAIRAAAERLGASAQIEVVQAEALAWLNSTSQRFDIVFLDPPYGSGLLPALLGALPRLLANGNRVYLEWPGSQTLALPQGYRSLKEKRAGGVSYGLIGWLREPAEGGVQRMESGDAEKPI